MSHINVIVLITPKQQLNNPEEQLITPQAQAGSAAAGLWQQKYGLPGGRTGRSARDAVRKLLAPYNHLTGAARPPDGDHIGWDGYEIGGRWAGQFLPDPEEDASDAEDARSEQPSARARGAEGDIAPVARVPAGVIPSVVVTPDGVWHECPVWYGVVRQEPGLDNWEIQVGRLLAQHRDAVAVNVDVHI